MNRIKDASNKATRRLQRVVDNLYPKELLVATCLDMGDRFICLVGIGGQDEHFVVRFGLDSDTSRLDFVTACKSAVDLMLSQRQALGHEAAG